MFNSVFHNKRVIITGNTGFKGSWLTMWLLKLGANVLGISKDVPTTPSLFKSLKLYQRISYVEQDIRDLEQTRRNIIDFKPDFLFHLAAQPIVSSSYRDPLETITTNVVGTANILEILRSLKHSCSAVIVTSDKCYDNVEWVWGYKESDALGGKDIYSASKGAAELVFKAYFHSFFKTSTSIRLASVRAGNVIGGGDWGLNRIVPDCMRAWSQAEIVKIRSPHATRPWQHVLEPLSGYLSTACSLFQKNDLSGESFNFGPKSDHNFTVNKIIEDLSKYWNFQNSNKSYQIVPNESFAEAGLLKLNCDKALYHLQWLPTLSYEQMIESVSTWYFTYYQGSKNMLDFTNDQISHYEQIAKDKGYPWTK